MNAKSILFNRTLPELKSASRYFTTAAIAQRVQELGLEISEGTLPVYLAEAKAKGLIHDAGRGWYSGLSEPVPLDVKPVAQRRSEIRPARRENGCPAPHTFQATARQRPTSVDRKDPR